jgi:hypothetical protein
MHRPHTNVRISGPPSSPRGANNLLLGGGRGIRGCATATAGHCSDLGRTRRLQDLRRIPQLLMRSAPSMPAVSIASVTSDVLHAAVASFWEVAMLSAPVFDSWEGPKRQGAIGDAILGKKIFPAYAHTPHFRPFGRGGPKTFSRKPPPHCAALLRIVSGGAGARNRSLSGACGAAQAATIVHECVMWLEPNRTRTRTKTE